MQFNNRVDGGSYPVASASRYHRRHPTGNNMPSFYTASIVKLLLLLFFLSSCFVSNLW